MKNPAEKPNEAQIWALNYRLLSGVLADASPGIAKLGLEIKGYFVLAEVERYPFPAQLAACLLMPKPTITYYLKDLEANGFVRREIDVADLRRHKLALTAAGRKALGRASRVLSESFGTRLHRLAKADQERFRALLAKLV